MDYPERYLFAASISNFTQFLYDRMIANNDKNWDVVRISTSYDNWGTLVFTNKKDPNMMFVMSLFRHTDGISVRWGIDKYDDPNDAVPDIHTKLGVYNETPFHAYGGSNYNVNYNWDVITTPEGIVIIGEPTDYTNVAYQFRAYLGRCKSYEVEDPAIANDFLGVFPHMPMALHDTNQTNYDRYTPFGRGIVRKSRNASEYEYYMFNTDSVIRSPGVGNRYYLQPFIVHHDLEGVRGEFWGLKTCVFKDKEQHPDGTILDLGENKYYVVHVNSKPSYPTSNNWRRYEISNEDHIYWTPYFFGSGFQLFGQGQRALLIQVEGV